MPKYQHLLTPEGEVLTGMPWPDYPRPQLVRDSFINLNGPWDYACAFSKRIPERFPQQIRVPFPPESLLSGIGRVPRRYAYQFYKRELVIPDGFVQDRVLLHFGAVDQIATVYLNGKELACHTGGYQPFSVDLTDYLQATNTLVVRVLDTLSHSLPYGKQRRRRGGMWYTPVSGIWQTVWLESLPTDPIRALKITPTLDAVSIEVDSTATVKMIQITTPQGVIAKTFEGKSITLPIDNPLHWSPEHPHLYPIKITTATDAVTSYFALRTLSIRAVDGLPRLCLNDQPYYFHGVLDQGYFSDGLYLPASSDGYRNDILAMKSLGFNTLRKHVKVEPAAFYHLCDTLGIFIFQDMPNLGHYSFLRDTALPTLGHTTFNDKRKIRTRTVRKNYIRQLQDTIDHLYNHPCIALWTLFNEGWGQFDSDGHYQRAKQLDPTRFVNSTSGWFHQHLSDVTSLHLYFKPIAVSCCPRPIVLSEFGGYSFKLLAHAFNRQKTYGYRFFEDAISLQTAIEKVFHDEVAAQIAKGLCASVYTQLSDVEDETNGFLTYDRRVLKVDAAVMQRVAERLTIQ